MNPRIAIPLPTSADLIYNERNWPVYAACLKACSAEPVAFPLGLSTREVGVLAATCQGVCLPGSPADVDPYRYGHERDPATAPADPPREQVDRLLLEEVFGAGKPLLAICFGLQSLNVFRGGTLLQDLLPMPVNHEAGASVGIAHMVSAAQGSLLARLAIDGTEANDARDTLRVPVNSSHHQAVGVAGTGLRITGRCSEDGVVEALELDTLEDHPFLLGVQWHPERSFTTRESRALFEAFVAAARIGMLEQWL